MASNISFQENESIFFRHKATHNNEQGELIITNLRVCFSFSNNQMSSVQLPWQSIDKTKYTPLNDPKGRVMLMIQTVQKSNPIIFQFVGELQSCQKELERLKEIISKIRSVTESAVTSSSVVSTSAASATTAISTTINQTITTKTNITKSDVISSSVLESRKKLLEADKQLASKYRDLVLTDKILTEQDFWKALEQNHGSSYHSTLHPNDTYIDPTVRGKSTSLFADVKKTYKNGKLTVNLTTETKESIFLLYPGNMYDYI